MVEQKLSGKPAPTPALDGFVDRFGWACALVAPATAMGGLYLAQRVFADSGLALGALRSTVFTECSLSLRLELLASRAHWLAMMTLMATASVCTVAFAVATIHKFFPRREPEDASSTTATAADGASSAARELWRTGLLALIAAAAVGFAIYSRDVLLHTSAKGFLSLLTSSLPTSGWIHKQVMAARLVGEGAALALAVALAAVTTFARTITSSELAARFHALRTGTYVGSVLFVIGVMMCRANFAWVFANWSVCDEKLLKSIEAAITAGVVQAGAAYSVLLFAAVASARLLLERKLASAMTEAERTRWRGDHLLSSTFRTELQQVLAVLAPVLSAPVFDAIAKL